MNPLFPPSAMGWIVSLWFLDKGGFGIEYPTIVDVSLNKEIKPVSIDYIHSFCDYF